MIDIQNESPDYSKTIDSVGVKGVQYPVVVMDKKNIEQSTVALIDMFVSLPKNFRGTHMSRFIEILNNYRGKMSRINMKKILKEIKRKLAAERSQIQVSFPYFIEKTAPVSKSKSILGYDCMLHGVLDEDDNFTEMIEVKVPVHNLCPCSKEISKTGAHNQRGTVTVRISSRKLFWIEDIVSWVEERASAPVYPLLKRSDEKWITETAYERPRFVEDIVRLVSRKLDSFREIEYYSIKAENQESIHNHNAYALIEKRLADGD